jgi:DNA polymerase I-like protein with 3'-5' exonuclease and polymerase domains
MVQRAGIPRQRIIIANIFGLIDKPLVKYRTEKTPRFNPERKQQILEAVNLRIKAVKPTLIVCSDPVSLGIFTNWDMRVSTLDKCRGGVYEYQGITVIVTLPVTAIHRNVDERLLKDDEGEDVKYEPYKIAQGAWILARDWEKISRYYHGKQRRLPPFRYSICRTTDDCFAARKWLLDCALISIDIETGCFPAQITCVGYTGINKKGQVRTFVIPFYDEYAESGCFWDSEDDHAIAYMIMCDINQSPVLKVMQNGNYDASYFIRDLVGLVNWLLDTMLMWYSMYMELPKSLDFISSILLDNYQYWKDDIKGQEQKDEIQGNMERYWRYNGLDTYYTLFNCLYMLSMMNRNPVMQFNYRDVFMRAMSALRISMRGVKADFKRLAEHREKLMQDYEKSVNRLRYLIGDPQFNVNSAPQKVSLLYDVLGARERNARGRFIDPSKPRRDSNSPSAGAIALKAIKTEHPIFKYIIEALESTMEPDKQMGNITGRVGPDGKITAGIKFFTDRFRTCYGAAGTTSTRFNSKSSNFWDGTNAQNIRAEYRDFLVADDGCILMDVDYSQSDDVFVGYESNDPTKIAVIESGVDGHAVHGELFFKTPYDAIVAGKRAGDPAIIHPIYGIRQLSKRIVHGTNFQMAALTLLMWMGRDSAVASMKLMGHKDAESWTQDQLVNGCQQLMNSYRRKYPRLTPKEWYKEIADELRNKGTLTNAFGITRRFLGDPNDHGTQREATGFMGQSDTAGNMNRSMYEIDHGYIPTHFRDGENPDRNDTPRRMDLQSHGFRLLLQTHDSFTAQLSLDHPRFEEAVHNLLYVMERPVIINGHTVRVKTEASFGLRWGKKMIEYNPNKDSLSDVVAKALATTK